MTGRPTVTVKLDDGTGTFPYDITAYVRLTDGIEISRGRSDEFDTPQPGRLTLTLNNRDGRFTFGNATYNVDRDQQIRVQYKVGANPTRTRFTGYVEEWPISWESPNGAQSVVQITAYDRLASLSRRTLRTLIEQQVLGNPARETPPVAYYTLGEAEGSTTAGDTSGSIPTPSAMTVAGSGTAPIFGSAAGPGVDPSTAASFFGGQYFTTNIPAGAGFTGFEVWFQRAAPPAAMETVASIDVALFELNIETSGKMSLYQNGPTNLAAQTTASVCDGAWHHAFVTDDGAGTCKLYVDGVLQGTFAYGSWTWTNSRPITVGGNKPIGTGWSNFSGSLAHFAIWNMTDSPVFWPSRILGHYTAGSTGFAGDSSDLRVTRLVVFIGAGSSGYDINADVETGLLLSVPAQAIGGTSALTALQDVSYAEGGLLFVAGDGKLTMQNRAHRPLAAVAAATLTATTKDTVPNSLRFTADKRYLKNRVTATAASTGSVQEVLDATSLAAHEEYPFDIGTLLVPGDDEALSRAQWVLANGKEPDPRLESLTLDLMSATGAIQDAALQCDMSSRVAMSGFPSQAPSSTTSLFVEGLTDTLTEDAWTLELTTTPADEHKAWILGDSTYGVLGTTTTLYF